MGGGMMGGSGGGMMGGRRGQGGPGSSGAVDYPLYLINGRAPNDPETLNVRRGRGEAAPDQPGWRDRLPLLRWRAQVDRHPFRRAARANRSRWTL